MKEASNNIPEAKAEPIKIETSSVGQVESVPAIIPTKVETPADPQVLPEKAKLE
jgi:hypothetical protein